MKKIKSAWDAFDKLNRKRMSYECFVEWLFNTHAHIVRDIHSVLSAFLLFFCYLPAIPISSWEQISLTFYKIVNISWHFALPYTNTYIIIAQNFIYTKLGNRHARKQQNAYIPYMQAPKYLRITHTSKHIYIYLNVSLTAKTIKVSRQL